LPVESSHNEKNSCEGVLFEARRLEERIKTSADYRRFFAFLAFFFFAMVFKFFRVVRSTRFARETLKAFS